MEKQILKQVENSCRRLNEEFSVSPTDWTVEETKIYATALELRALILEYTLNHV